MASRREIQERSRAAAQARLAQRPYRLLDALSRAPDGLSTRQLVHELGESIALQQALTRYGQELHRHETAGRVERAGQTRGGYQRPPSWVWRITTSGRAWLSSRQAAATGTGIAGPDGTR